MLLSSNKTIVSTEPTRSQQVNYDRLIKIPLLPEASQVDKPGGSSPQEKNLKSLDDLVVISPSEKFVFSLLEDEKLSPAMMALFLATSVPEFEKLESHYPSHCRQSAEEHVNPLILISKFWGQNLIVAAKANGRVSDVLGEIENSRHDDGTDLAKVLADRLIATDFELYQSFAKTLKDLGIRKLALDLEMGPPERAKGVSELLLARNTLLQSKSLSLGDASVAMKLGDADLYRASVQELVLFRIDRDDKPERPSRPITRREVTSVTRPSRSSRPAATSKPRPVSVGEARKIESRIENRKSYSPAPVVDKPEPTEIQTNAIIPREEKKEFVDLAMPSLSQLLNYKETLADLHPSLIECEEDLTSVAHEDGEFAIHESFNFPLTLEEATYGTNVALGVYTPEGTNFVASDSNVAEHKGSGFTDNSWIPQRFIMAEKQGSTLPDHYSPGSDDKVRLLEERYAAGEDLFQVGDPTDFSKVADFEFPDLDDQEPGVDELIDSSDD